jgi:YHS domain-containing protein
MKSHGVNEMFARRHLSTLVARATYRSLTAHAHPLSVQEIADANGIDEDDVERVLDGFAAAGIVETDGVTYQWSEGMNYLFGAPAAVGAVDPVCGMPVHEDSPHEAIDLYGRQERFCSSLCRAGFLAFRVYFSAPCRPTDEIRSA